MPLARKETVCESESGIYHCISRCVRQAFLCGYDAYTGRSYEHRKDLVKSRLRHLAECFAIDVFAYAVMSNHLHVVIRNRPDIVEHWTDEEVALQWLKVFPADGRHDKPLDLKSEAARLALNKERISELRPRLASISWFMRCLNEFIARQANREDGCKGRFWEGRFRSQALLDETAVLTCMAYVDLNPIRAGIAQTPEASHFTSIHDRILALRNRQPGKNGQFSLKKNRYISDQKNPAKWLTPFINEVGDNQLPIIDMQAEEYFNLVDWTGRQVRSDNKSNIPENLAPILSRLGIDANLWRGTVNGYGSLFHRAVGKVESMVDAAHKAGLLWFGGIRNCARAFSYA